MEIDRAQELVSSNAVLVLLAVAGIAVVMAAVRIVPEHERVVVTRFGRLVRVVGPGLARRVPGLEAWRTVSLRSSSLRLAVSTFSSDGVPVHVQVLAVCRVVEPELVHLADPDPAGATGSRVESLVAREVANVEVAELLSRRGRLESVLPSTLTAETRDFGVRVDEIEINDIEVRVTMALLESLRSGRLEDRR